MECVDYDKLCEMVATIGNDIHYAVVFKVTHLLVTNRGRRKEIRKHQTNFYTLGGNTTYEYSTLSAMYVDNESMFHNINYKFILNLFSVDGYLVEGISQLNKAISSIIDSNVPLKSVIMGSTVRHLEWLEVLAVLRKLDDNIPLTKVTEVLMERDSYWEGSFVPKSHEDLMTKIHVRLLEHDTNVTTFTNVGYIKVTVPILSHGHDYSDTIQFIKNFKRDIDRVVLNEIKRQLRHTGLSINFFKLVNCTFTRNGILEYTFSLKDINIKEDE